MEKILYYFYLLCFAGLAGLGIAEYFESGSLVSAVLIQLVWGPISFLHCLIKYLLQLGEDAKEYVPNTISLMLTVIYFVALFIIGNADINIGGAYEEAAFVLGIGVIPWTLLAYFTYNLHVDLFKNKDLNLPVDL